MNRSSISNPFWFRVVRVVRVFGGFIGFFQDNYRVTQTNRIAVICSALARAHTIVLLALDSLVLTGCSEEVAARD